MHRAPQQCLVPILDGYRSQGPNLYAGATHIYGRGRELAWNLE